MWSETVLVVDEERARRLGCRVSLELAGGQDAHQLLGVHAHERGTRRARGDREGQLEEGATDARREGVRGVDVDGGARGETVGDDARDESAERVTHHRFRGTHRHT